MRIGLTGGGSGGHFYPLIAVAEEINQIAHENGIVDLELYYFAPTPYDEALLYDNNITFKQVSAGKRRQYFSFLNFFDIFKTFFGSLVAVWKVFRVYPDVMFSKGGYVSVPVLFACRVLMIPVVIHESDTIPGKANRWAGKFAQRIAVSYPEATQYFKKQDRVAHTGQPIRKSLLTTQKDGSYEFFGLEQNVPTILILGGSQGAMKINDVLLQGLPELVSEYNIIHQAGENNAETVKKTADLMLLNNQYKNRYKLFGSIDAETTRRAAGIADLIISRAGSTIFEIAVWGVPSIIIPIQESSNNHQKQNAFVYAQSKAGTVVDENNMTENIIKAEIKRILSNPSEREEMKKSAQAFGSSVAARKIANEIVGLALEHQ